MSSESSVNHAMKLFHVGYETEVTSCVCNRSLLVQYMRYLLLV